MKDVVSVTEGLFAFSKVRPFSFSPSCTTYLLASCCLISTVLSLLATPFPSYLITRTHLLLTFLLHNLQETAQLESGAFVERQKVALVAEVKTVLDSWVRFEQQAKESERAEPVKPVVNSVLKNFSNDEMQKDILASAVAEIERTPLSLPFPPSVSSVVSFCSLLPPPCHLAFSVVLLALCVCLIIFYLTIWFCTCDRALIKRILGTCRARQEQGHLETRVLLLLDATCSTRYRSHLINLLVPNT